MRTPKEILYIFLILVASQASAHAQSAAAKRSIAFTDSAAPAAASNAASADAAAPAYDASNDSEDNREYKSGMAAGLRGTLSGFSQLNIFNQSQHTGMIYTLQNAVGHAYATGMDLANNIVDRCRPAEIERTVLESAQVKAKLGKLKRLLTPHAMFGASCSPCPNADASREMAQNAAYDVKYMLHYVTLDSRRRSVPLLDEVDFMCCYLNLVSMGMGPRFSCTLDAPESSSARIAPMTLFSIVKSACRQTMCGASSCSLHISLKVDGQQNLHFVVVSSNAFSGVEKLEKRLQRDYPNRHELVVGSHGNGFEARLTIALADKER